MAMVAACSDGRTFSTPEKIGELEKLALRFAESAAFAVAATTADGTPVVVWESRDSPSTIFLEKLPLSRGLSAADSARRFRR